MKALVTGGGGFLGRAIVEMLLGRGNQVRILARNDYPVIRALGAEAVQGDIRNLDDVLKACMGVDVVFHTAALPGIWGDADVFVGINVTGTQNVIAACKRRGVSKLVFTSSPSVVFDMKDESGIDERAPYPSEWFNPYSQTKALAEQAVLQANGKDGLLTCSLRPHLIWGPRDNHLLPRVIARAKRRRLRIVGQGLNKVDLTYIDNAALAHLFACDAMTSSRVAGQAYFISDDNPVLLWEWINDFLGRLSLPLVKKRVPASIAYGIGYCFEYFYDLFDKMDEPPMTRFLARTFACSHYYNIEKAKRDFKYKPAITNEEGMKRTIEFFKSQEQSPK